MGLGLGAGDRPPWSRVAGASCSLVSVEAVSFDLVELGCQGFARQEDSVGPCFLPGVVSSPLFDCQSLVGSAFVFGPTWVDPEVWIVSAEGEVVSGCCVEGFGACLSFDQEEFRQIEFGEDWEFRYFQFLGGCWGAFVVPLPFLVSRGGPSVNPAPNSSHHGVI